MLRIEYTDPEYCGGYCYTPGIPIIVTQPRGTAGPRSTNPRYPNRGDLVAPTLGIPITVMQPRGTAGPHSAHPGIPITVCKWYRQAS